jgi:hypothetical protein
VHITVIAQKESQKEMQGYQKLGNPKQIFEK